VITRHGRPAAKLAPAVPAVSLQEREAIFRRVGANAEAWGVQHPEAAAPVPWEQVKAWMEEDR
jgi:antitoxin (DNA-binding transcriptional repressor) of toxin-antitoxin stability system